MKQARKFEYDEYVHFYSAFGCVVYTAIIAM